nr:unnamed protein product [Rangifer tarandus platyrhynchus]
MPPPWVGRTTELHPVVRRAAGSRKLNENNSLKCWNGTQAPRRRSGLRRRQAGARPGLRRQAAEAGQVAGIMALFHFRNRFALAYFRYFTTYKCSGLSESSAFWKCVQAGVAYLFVQLCTMLFLVTFPPGKAAYVTSLGSS